MKNLRHSKFTEISSQDSEENVLPLINIVFLLLIFFLMAGTISTPDIFEVTPPSSISDNPELSSELTVLIGKNNRYAFENIDIPIKDLSKLIQSSVTNHPNQKYKIKADHSVDSGAVITVMEILRDAGVQQITLITLKDQ